MRNRDLKLKVLYISGHTDIEADHQGLTFLQKPFPSQKLAQKIRES